MDIKTPVLMAASYLLGGIPSGYLIARALKGIDIRQHGSGNPGAANVYRTVGKWAGWCTFALDASKGFIPVLIARHYYPQQYLTIILCGALAITGHMWTVFLGFRGGKGVATSAGVFGAVLPLPTLAAFMVFILAVALSGHISVGSMCAGIVLPVLSFALGYPAPLSAMAAVVSALILYKHIPNLKRILAGRELAFKDGGRAGADGVQK